MYTIIDQALDVVQQSKIAEVLGGGEVKEHQHHTGGQVARGGHRRRSQSRDRLDNVAYDKSATHGDEVSIGLQWSGDGVSNEYRVMLCLVLFSIR